MAYPRTEIESVRAFNFKKHSLYDRDRFNDIHEVVTRMVGLHSARLSTPFVALAARMPLFCPQQLIEELYVHASLIKLRCMRKTLHTVPLSMAPLVHQATKSYRLHDCASFYKRNNIAAKTISDLRNQVLSLLSQIPLASKQIISRMRHQSSASVELIRSIIKHLWEEGLLCYVNNAKVWRKEDRVYALTKTRYPTLNLEEISPQEAQERLVLLHIEAYGPVSEKDIAWWSGLPRMTIRRAIERHATAVTAIEISDSSEIFYVSSAEVTTLLKTEGMVSCFRLLAHEDPLLKAYHHSRFRYVNEVDYGKLFNAIGEARAGIFKNGVAIGTWTWGKNNDIDLSFFGSVSRPERRLIELEATHIRTTLESSEGSESGLA